MKLAIDAMGGDNAPEEIVKGSVQAAERYPDLELALVGDEPRIKQLLGSGSSRNIEIVHTTEIISADDEPVRAVRRKKDASMTVAARMVKEGLADGFVSAGNTGALMAAGLLIIGRIEGIERPALASVWPTFDGRGVLVLDVGANMDAEPLHLLQYAAMGNLYARYVLSVDKPRVGLLNVGTEPGKGNALAKAAYPMLEGKDFHFVGNVESREILNGVCDVVVCDGFVGNVMLKLIEGVGLGMFDALKEVFMAGTVSKLAALALKPGLKQFKKKFDYAEYGGAPLLGVNGVCIKAHGSSKARAFEMAIHQGRQFLHHGVLDQIRMGAKGDESR
ncbi:phosphate acyltransferase PlsX [Effusibacillus lacus]|uniref:Phosphate acyltransferase n=1 Tax=Effusibacillus lacus TaxID=1348429 RepID=A0A292YPT1_9BACL|nr:phosphate acyltransferase PlsX [Effusibacillus lacus]TCS76580.1 phosphate:acyl-[acyl carrier protein] acyltransferase [Effusibacillus lacus]GAX90404.1 phosphate acyltransferase [Effusibacillus lacus]